MTDPQRRPDDAGHLHLHHHARLPDRLHADGDGRGFGYYAYYQPGQEFFDNRVFYLLSQNTFSIMTNDALVAVPLFLFMGYIVERANILDRLFHSLQMRCGTSRGRWRSRR